MGLVGDIDGAPESSCHEKTPGRILDYLYIRRVFFNEAGPMIFSSLILSELFFFS